MFVLFANFASGSRDFNTIMDHKELNELLECSVCLERLDHTSKVLPCQHTFCKRCLVEIQSMRKELRCPECRVLVEEDIDNLLPNILLIRILEGLNRRNPVPDIEKSVKQVRIIFLNVYSRGYLIDISWGQMLWCECLTLASKTTNLL